MVKTKPLTLTLFRVRFLISTSNNKFRARLKVLLVILVIFSNGLRFMATWSIHDGGHILTSQNIFLNYFIYIIQFCYFFFRCTTWVKVLPVGQLPTFVLLCPIKSSAVSNCNSFVFLFRASINKINTVEDTLRWPIENLRTLYLHKPFMRLLSL